LFLEPGFELLEGLATVGDFVLLLFGHLSVRTTLVLECGIPPCAPVSAVTQPSLTKPPTEVRMPSGRYQFALSISVSLKFGQARKSSWEFYLSPSLKGNGFVTGPFAVGECRYCYS